MVTGLGELRIVPLTERVWPALEELLGESGPGSRCWCMYWRIGAEYRRREAAENKADFFQIMQEGPVGLVAFAGELAVGWCQVTPRGDLARLEKRFGSQAPGKSGVWAISCFYVRKGYRRKGVTASLIEAAKTAATKDGAEVLEAYPLDREVTPSSSSTGFKSTFLRLGFRAVEGQEGKSQVVMRVRL